MKEEIVLIQYGCSSSSHTFQHCSTEEKKSHCKLLNKLLSGQMNTKEKSGSQGLPNPVKSNIWKIHFKMLRLCSRSHFMQETEYVFINKKSKILCWGLFLFLSLNLWFVYRLCYTQCRNTGSPAAYKDLSMNYLWRLNYYNKSSDRLCFRL